MRSHVLSTDDRIRIRSILLELEEPYREFQVYDRWEDNSDLREDYWKKVLQLNDSKLVDRLPTLDSEKLLRLPYWSLREACGFSVGWPAAVMEIDKNSFITPGSSDELGLEDAKVKYDELLELASRSIDLGDLNEKCRPDDFIRWANQYPELTSENLQRLANENPKIMLEDRKQTLSTKERRTAHIIIYSLAKDYGWRPQGNSDAVGKLARAIENLADSKGDERLRVSERTIRKWLRDSKMMVDGND